VDQGSIGTSSILIGSSTWSHASSARNQGARSRPQPSFKLRRPSQSRGRSRVAGLPRHTVVRTVSDSCGAATHATPQASLGLEVATSHKELGRRPIAVEFRGPEAVRGSASGGWPPRFNALCRPSHNAPSPSPIGLRVSPATSAQVPPAVVSSIRIRLRAV